jgi:hypothetical protein
LFQLRDGRRLVHSRASRDDDAHFLVDLQRIGVLDVQHRVGG